MKLKTLCITAASLWLGCGQVTQPAPHAPELDTQGQAMTVENGRSLNGRSLNGRSLNGRSLNGRSLNGRSLNGRSLNGRDANAKDIDGVRFAGANFGGVALASLRLEGAELEGTTHDGKVLRGQELVGLELTLDSGGFTAPIRIDSYGAHPESPDVPVYGVASPSGEDLCGDGRGERVPAVALAGRWNYGSGVDGGGAHVADPDRFTFACRSFALEKCVEIGYRPWEGLAELHQACTRVLRADYCGDGRSYTKDGEWINLYDAYGMQTDTEAWSFEAEWDQNGARCLSERRISQGKVRCERPLALASCGDTSHFGGDATLLMTEFEE